jgi:uncharacterized protein YjbI with pentapeptide repeats
VTLAQIGGVGGALAGEAQRVYDSLSPEEQAIARRVFLGLVQLGEEVRDTRRRAHLSELIASDSEAPQVRGIIARFAANDARFLTTSLNQQYGETIEVTHEALIRNWSQLRDWLNGNREALRQKQKIEQAAAEWVSQGRSKEYLLQGRPLRDAREFMKTAQGETAPSNLATQFVQYSQGKQRNDRLKRFVISLLIPTMLTSSIFHFGIVQFADWKLHQGGCQPDFTSRFLLQYLLVFRYGDKLSGINLCGKQLPGIDLSGSHVNLWKADFSDSYLTGAILKYTNLNEADFENAKLLRADLQKTLLISANLQSANLLGSDLSDAIFINVKTRNTSFKNADMTNTVIINTDLSNARDLTFEQVSQAKICESKLPSNIQIKSNKNCSDPEVINWLPARKN